MSWSSIASKAPIAAPAKQPPKAPVKQDKPPAAPVEAAPAKKANAAAPTVAAPAKIAPIAAPSAPKVSSWASKVGSSVKPTPPKGAPKQSALAQAPAKTSAAPSPVVVSKIPPPITITKAEGWGQLPADILSHHLAPIVEHTSTIRVLRRLNRHYAKSISLPSVRMDPPRDGYAPFFGALSVCDSAEVTLEDAAFVTGALEHLKKNPRLKELRLQRFGPLEADLLKNIGSLLESAPLLETIGLNLYRISDPQLAIFTGALQRSNSRIKNVSVFFQGEDLSKNMAAFIACLASIGVEKFTLSMHRLQPEVAKALARWLSSPSCSLIEFTSVYQTFGDVAATIIDGYKLNRSLRRLNEAYVPASSASRFVDAIVQQGKIEHLTFSVEGDTRSEPLFDLVTKNERVKCDGSVLPRNVTSETYADEKTICDYIKSDKCVSCFNHIRASLWRYRNSRQLVEALKANRTMKEMTIYAGEYQEDSFYFGLIAGNPNLHTLIISYFTNCHPDLKAAMKQNQGLKKVILEKDFSMEIAAAEMKKVVSAIGQVRSLEQLVFLRGNIDSCVSELSTLIKTRKNLRRLELGGCKMSEATLIQILTAIASNGGLEDLNMREVELHSLSSSRDTFNKALLRVLETNPLQQLSMDSWELDPSTINCIVSALDKMETLTLRIWDLGKINMPAVVRKNVDGLVNRKGGLLKVFFI